MTKQYLVNEIFYSLQGEGVRAGTANVFVRFSGCNMRCTVEPGDKSPGGFDCDTEFMSGRKMTAREILNEAWKMIPEELNMVPWMILTGGEPGLQVDPELCSFMREHWRVAIETNGSVGLDHLKLDWITVSPKVAEHAIRQKTADEVKYVRGYGQGIPKTVVDAEHKLISPAFDGMVMDPRTLQWCTELVKENPEWRLSQQLHKSWSIR